MNQSDGVQAFESIHELENVEDDDVKKQNVSKLGKSTAKGKEDSKDEDGNNSHYISPEKNKTENVTIDDKNLISFHAAMLCDLSYTTEFQPHSLLHRSRDQAKAKSMESGYIKHLGITEYKVWSWVDFGGSGNLAITGLFTPFSDPNKVVPFICFRGTQTVKDMMDDVKSLNSVEFEIGQESGRTGKGQIDAYKSLRDLHLSKPLRTPMIFNGQPGVDGTIVYTADSQTPNVVSPHAKKLFGKPTLPSTRSLLYGNNDEKGGILKFMHEMGLRYKRILITGHSLGGAMATLMSLDIMEQILRPEYNEILPYQVYVVTFGSPRCTSHLPKIHGHEANKLPFAYSMRYINEKDLIAKLGTESRFKDPENGMEDSPLSHFSHQAAYFDDPKINTDNNWHHNSNEDQLDWVSKYDGLPSTEDLVVFVYTGAKYHLMRSKKYGYLPRLSKSPELKVAIENLSGDRKMALNNLLAHLEKALEEDVATSDTQERAMEERLIDLAGYIKHVKMPESIIANVSDYPLISKWFTFFFYYIGFVVMVLYFVIQQYIHARTSSFITLDKNSGVCVHESESYTCCEVPQSVTGTFLADTFGNWDTSADFSYTQSNYGVTLVGLEYDDHQWTKVMKDITASVKAIGERGKHRDYAWNLVAWSSFSAQDLTRGLFQFYSSGDARIIYNTDMINFGIGSNVSDTEHCFIPYTHYYESTTGNLHMTLDLCDSPPCWVNPCPDVFAPFAFGYDPSTYSRYMELEISLSAVNTALAVNMGMITLNHLVRVPGDNNRASLLAGMVAAGAITEKQAEHTSSYYDSWYSPQDNIYCYSEHSPEVTLEEAHSWVSGYAYCLVRMGNTLAYPVTTSYGWSNDGESYPSKCTKSDVHSNGAANYYCNLMDITVAFIYYPVDNHNANDTYTFSPTFAPSPTPNSRRVTELSDIDLESSMYSGSYPASDSTSPASDSTSASSGDTSSGSSGDSTSGSSSGSSSDSSSDSSSSYSSASSYSTSATYEANDAYSSPEDDESSSYYYEHYDVYAANSKVSSYKPLIPEVIDNGYIFAFGEYAAKRLKHKPIEADIFVAGKAYNAVIDTLIGTELPDKDDQYHSFDEDFHALCSSDVHDSIQPGCAVMAFEFYGKLDRSISPYYYQPSSTPAFSDTLYVHRALKSLQYKSPTSLIEKYYSCVLDPWHAFFAAVGLGVSNAATYLAFAFLIYMVVTLYILNKYHNANIPFRIQKFKNDAEKKEKRDREIDSMLRHFEALRKDVESEDSPGSISLNNLKKSFSSHIKRPVQATGQTNLRVTEKVSSTKFTDSKRIVPVK